MQQLTLPIHIAEQFTLDNFDSTNNVLLLNSLRATLLQNEKTYFYYIFAPSGAGKSHLLKACCDYVIQQGGLASFFSLKQLKALSTDCLQGLEQHDLICLDDLDSIAGNDIWEQAIFHLYNRVHEKKGRKFIISANAPIKALHLNLPDLRSRLVWGQVYQLIPLNEQQIQQQLQQRAAERGLVLPHDVVHFLLKRHARDTHSLFLTLDKLDKASLETQRKLTIPFVKAQLGL